jgi:hypothetical protein
MRSRSGAGVANRTRKYRSLNQPSRRFPRSLCQKVYILVSPREIYTMKEMMNPPAIVQFEDQDEKRIVKRVRSLLRRQVQDLIEIGKLLVELRLRWAGSFEAKAIEEFKCSRSTIYRAIQASEKAAALDGCEDPGAVDSLIEFETSEVDACLTMRHSATEKVDDNSQSGQGLTTKCRNCERRERVGQPPVENCQECRALTRATGASSSGNEATTEPGCDSSVDKNGGEYEDHELGAGESGSEADEGQESQSLPPSDVGPTTQIPEHLPPVLASAPRFELASRAIARAAEATRAVEESAGYKAIEEFETTCGKKNLTKRVRSSSLDALARELAAIKPVQVCPACGGHVPSQDAEWCAQCGGRTFLLADDLTE